MKKSYVRIGTIFSVIILLVFSLAIFIFTRLKIDEVNKQFSTTDNLVATTHIINDEESADISNTIKDTAYNRMWNIYYGGRTAEANGSYSSVIDILDSRSPVFELGDFLEIHALDQVVNREVTETEDSYSVKETVIPDDKGSRIIMLDDSFPSDCRSIPRASMSGGYCDDNFAFGGVLSWNDFNEYTYSVPTPSYVDPEKTVPFGEWMDNTDYYLEYHSFKGAYDDEAKKICDREVDSFISDKKSLEDYKNYLIANHLSGIDNTSHISINCAARDDQFKKGFFTSYFFSMNIGVYKDKVILAPQCRVIKPFRSVVTDNKATYIALIMALIITEAVAIFSVRALYRNQKSFEIRNRRLTRGLAHELKTPLAITKACVENWEYIDDSKRPEYSAKMISEVDHMSDIISRLLELSKLSSGNISIHPEPVDLLPLTKTICKRMDGLIRERQLDLTITCDDNEDPHQVYADLDMMNIVISNFISNAIKYSDHKVRIKLSHYGKRITFNINNDGATIPKTDLKKIWDVFYKTNESRSDRISSSGVGLSVVKNILDMHKAKYGCHSSRQGTTFWFTMEANRKKDV